MLIFYAVTMVYSLQSLRCSTDSSLGLVVSNLGCYKKNRPSDRYHQNQRGEFMYNGLMWFNMDLNGLKLFGWVPMGFKGFNHPPELT